MIATYTATESTVDAYIHVATRDDAERLAAKFPKSTRAYASTHTRPVDGSYLNGSETIGSVVFHANLTQTKTTGERNEAGLRRWHSFKRALDRLDIELAYNAPYTNSLSAADAAAL